MSGGILQMVPSSFDYNLLIYVIEVEPYNRTYYQGSQIRHTYSSAEIDEMELQEIDVEPNLHKVSILEPKAARSTIRYFALRLYGCPIGDTYNSATEAPTQSTIY
jgi:hypothetical protein